MKKPLLHFEEKFMHRTDKEIKENKFIQHYHSYLVSNHNNESIGLIEKMHVGKYMHWCFEPDEGTFFTNGCMKEIVEFITGLYSKEKNEKKLFR